MPQGFEVYGPDGSLWVGLTDYVGKLKGSVTYTPGVNDPSTVTVSAPGAAALTDPFCVLVDNQIQTVTSYVQSGTGSMDLHAFAAGSASVNAGQDSIDISGTWAYLVYRSVTVWYGSR